MIEHLRNADNTSTIALWGRSMGAATALLHGERDPSIASMVLDSAFSSLVTLAEEMVEMGRKQGLFAPGSWCELRFNLFDRVYKSLLILISTHLPLSKALTSVSSQRCLLQRNMITLSTKVTGKRKICVVIVHGQ